MKSKYNYIQIYNIWVNGRIIGDVDQQFPINTRINVNWHSDFKKAFNDFYKIEVVDNEDEEERGLYSDVYQDYIVILFGLDIDTDDFKERTGLDFDLDDPNVQETISTYVKFDFNTIAERNSKFK